MPPSPSTEDPLDKLDQLIDPAPEPENAVLTDNALVVRWTGPLFALFSLVLLPWTVYLGITLPSRQESPHYDVAWVGFDVFLLAVLAGTAYCALRRSRYLSTVAGATAALLLVDAWFDCLTTPGPQLWQSLALCFLIELPLAGLCLWLRVIRRHGRPVLLRAPVVTSGQDDPQFADKARLIGQYWRDYSQGGAVPG